MQVITPGYQIVLERDGERYYYHTNGTRGFKYCPTGHLVTPPPGGQ
jgi:hypothetical protein